MAGWQIIDKRYPYTYDEPPRSVTLERTDHSVYINYVPETTSTRGKMRTLLLDLWSEGSRFAYAEGSKERWKELGQQLVDILGELYDWEFSNEYCPFCGRKSDMPESIGRCRDCKWARPDQSDHDFRDPLVCTRVGAGVEPHDFCSRWLGKEDE